MKPEKQIAALISRVRSCINRFLIKELKQNGIEGLAPSHGGILFHLFNNEQVTMKQLATAVRRDKSTVTALVDKLVDKGFAHKTVCPEDQRTFYVHLTERGKSFQPVFEQVSERLISRIWQGIDPADQKEVIRILHQIESNFR